jgi:hypothetical protein
MTEWQPIETAPKDGSDILLWCPNMIKSDPAGALVGHWYKDSHNPRWHISNVCGWEWECDLNYEKATHWQPLPEPPK